MLTAYCPFPNRAGVLENLERCATDAVLQDTNLVIPSKMIVIVNARFLMFVEVSPLLATVGQSCDALKLKNCNAAVN